MLRMLSARTTEVDCVESARADILRQLGIDMDGSGLSGASGGLVFCSPDFVETGVAQAICGELAAVGCHVVGGTTMLSGVRGEHEMYSLSVIVLTGDDAEFSAAVTEPVSPEEALPAIERAYGEARDKLSAPPKLVITFFPFAGRNNYSEALGYIDALCEGAPIWGGVVCDTNLSFEHCHVIKDTATHQSAYSFLLVGGAVTPDFFLASLPLRDIQDRVATVTDSEGCIIKKIDGLTASDYFANAGIVFESQEELISIPLMVDYGDGAPSVALNFYNVDEAGAIYCAGDVPVGAKFSLGEVDYSGILETARHAMKEALGELRDRALLIISCVGRYILLSPDSEREAEIVEKACRDSNDSHNAMPYVFAYSGGEICPVPDRTGKFRNRFHNATFTVCAI